MGKEYNHGYPGCKDSTKVGSCCSDATCNEQLTIVFGTAKGSECCDMVHIMRKLGIGETVIKNAVIDFWKGAK